MSVSTVQRRLQDPQILAAVRAGRSQQRREAVGQLNIQVQPAIRRLRELVAHDDPRVALRAAALVLGSAHKFGGALEYDERLGLFEAELRGDEGS